MKTLLSLSCLFLVNLLYGQTDSALQRRIDSLYTIDQQVQTDMIAAYQRSAPQAVRDSLEVVKTATFVRQVVVLKEIISVKGLPTYRLVGKTSSDQFLTLVNHSISDIPFQERVASLAKREVKRKNISAPALAMMIDKMRINSNRQQLYGSQLGYDSTGTAFAVNLYKLKGVDKRRKKMGLPPLQEYLEMVTSLHREMNKKK